MARVRQMRSIDRILARAAAVAVDRFDRLAARPRAAALWLAAASTLVALVLAFGVLQRFPNSGDEYASVFQARTYAIGRLWVAAPPLPEFFETSYVFVDNGRAFGVFPPGWPLVLAAASRLGIPEWAVNAALGGLTIWLVFVLGRRLGGDREGLAAALLVAVSPFFLFNAASHFAHTSCGLFVLVGVLAAVRYAESARPADALTLGAAVGAAVLTRYYTGILCAIPMAVIVARPARRAVRALPWIVAGGAPFAAFLLYYNHELSGSAWRLSLSGVSLYFDHWFAPNWFLRGFDILATHLLRYVLWTPPAFIFVAIFLAAGSLRRPAAHRTGPRTIADPSHRGALALAALALAVGMFPYTDRGGNQYGPRYYYEAFPLLAIFVVSALGARLRAGVAGPVRGRAGVPVSGGEAGPVSGGAGAPAGWSSDAAARRLAGLLAVSLVLVVPLAAWHGYDEWRVIRERSDVFAQVGRAGPRRAVVLLSGRVGHRRSMAATDLTRNGITWDAAALYALDRGPDNTRLAAACPDRTFCRYIYDRSVGKGRLEPIVWPRADGPHHEYPAKEPPTP